MTAPNEWTPEAIAAEEQRRDNILKKWMCPDSGYTIERCEDRICDCNFYNRRRARELAP